MKATIIAVDFIKDTDGSFKALEINTGVGFHPLSASSYTDLTPITQFVSDNNLTEVEYIGSPAFGDVPSTPTTLLDLTVGDPLPGTNFGPRALGMIKDFYSSEEGYTYTAHPTQVGATSVPYIEDTPSKLILRNAYDSTALVDTAYAQSSIGFLELVKTYCTGSNAVEVPKSFIAPYGEDGTKTYGELLANDPQYDTIDINDIRDNGPDMPNYIVKLNSSTVESDYLNYPKVLKISTSEELDNLKKSLTANFILQEYIYNPADLEEGKAKTYRIISAIAGPSLESLHFFHPYFVTNHTPIPAAPDYRDDSSVQPWDRVAFVQKLDSLQNTNFGQNVLGDQIILGGDNQEVDPDSLDEGYVLKAFQTEGMPEDEKTYSIDSWRGEFKGTRPGIFSPTAIAGVDHLNTVFFSNEITLSDGSIIGLPDSADILGVTENETQTLYHRAVTLKVGDKILSLDPETEDALPVVLSVQSIARKLRTEQAIRIDVENIDTFVVKQAPQKAFVLHNGYWGACTCVYCAGYNSGGNPCLNQSCYSYPGCVTGYTYCYGYEDGFDHGCVQDKQ